MTNDQLQMTNMSIDLSTITIEKKPFEGEVHDVMEGAGRWETKVHDHGLVALIDVMPRFAPAGKTADYAIVQAARVSYGAGTKQINEDKGLIRYLARHRHTTPFEMCLAGGTLIPTMPCPGATRKAVPLKRIVEAFRGSKPEPWVRQMKIRTVGPDGTLAATHIRDARWTGVKPVYRVKTQGPLQRSIVATDNHPFLTPDGYRALRELRPGDRVMLNGKAVLAAPDLVRLWDDSSSIDAIADALGVSRTTAYRRLRRAGVDTSKRAGIFSRKSDYDLADPRARARKLKKPSCEICGHPAQEVHHLDKDEHNNSSENLLSLCIVCHNAFHNDPFQLRVYPGTIESIEPVGVDDVYDVEVESGNHNFVADGFVVHNCEFKFHHVMPIFIARQWIRHRTANVNEYSARYSVVRDRFYHPDLENVRKQSTANRQGGEEPIDAATAQEFLDYLDRCEEAYQDYQRLMEKGVAREIARIGLPVNVYTEWYWKIDLHNLFHFLSLRMDAHAQQEIRDYANAMFALIQPIVPIAAEAFIDYNFESLHLSKLEVEALRTGQPLKSENKRENAEWEEKRRKLGM
jgi:flavin-dependent thymidylate synthase